VLRLQIAVGGDLLGKGVLLHAAGVAAGLGGALGVFSDYVVEFVGHGQAPERQTIVSPLLTYRVSRRFADKMRGFSKIVPSLEGHALVHPPMTRSTVVIR
jgi:hypothetical protein